MNARVDKDHTTSVSGGLIVTRKPETVEATSSRMAFEQLTMTANDEFGLAFATEQILTDSPQSFVAILQAGFRDEYVAAAMKERIGDALRNAAMRFGAALDLWHKGDLHLDPDADPEADKRKAAAQQKAQTGSTTTPATTGTATEGEGINEGMKKTIRASLTKKDVDEGRLLRAFKVEHMDQLKKAAINDILAWINGEGQS